MTEKLMIIMIVVALGASAMCCFLPFWIVATFFFVGEIGPLVFGWCKGTWR